MFSILSQYAAKEFQQALDILDLEEPVNKKMLERSGKEDTEAESTKDWGMSPASVSSASLFKCVAAGAFDNVVQ